VLDDEARVAKLGCPDLRLDEAQEVRVDLDADGSPAKPVGDRRGRSAPEERVEHDLAGERVHPDQPPRQLGGKHRRMANLEPVQRQGDLRGHPQDATAGLERADQASGRDLLAGIHVDLVFGDPPTTSRCRSQDGSAPGSACSRVRACGRILPFGSAGSRQIT